MENTRKGYLDVIRCCSAIVIVLFHFSCLLVDFGYSGYSNFFLEYANGRWGRIGVLLFFMISGSGLILGSREHFDVKAFYKKRWMKLFPLFFLCYIPLYFVDAILIHKEFLYAGSPLKFLLTFVGMDGYLSEWIPNYYIIGEWFLGALILIYVLFPILRKLFLSKARLWITAVLAVLVVWNDICHFPYIPGREWIVLDITAFWCGMLMVEYEDRMKNRICAAVAGITAVVLLLVKLPIGENSDTISLLFSLSLFMTAMNCFGRVRSKAVKFIGDYSYAVFLVHHVIMAFFFTVFAKYITPYTVLPVIALLFVIILCTAYVAAKVNQSITQRRRHEIHGTGHNL